MRLAVHKHHGIAAAGGFVIFPHAVFHDFVHIHLQHHHNLGADLALFAVGMGLATLAAGIAIRPGIVLPAAIVERATHGDGDSSGARLGGLFGGCPGQWGWVGLLVVFAGGKGI